MYVFSKALEYCLFSIQGRTANDPTATNSDPNSPTTPETIETLPMGLFRQVSDQFNQTEWSVENLF
jgi:hypothetical protein